MTDPTDEIPTLEWAHGYNGYERIASESALLLAVPRPLREAFERDGVIPDWAGVDSLRSWAFCIASEYHWSGGYVSGHGQRRSNLMSAVPLPAMCDLRSLSCCRHSASRCLRRAW